MRSAALAIGSSLLLAAIGVDRTPHSVITPSWYFFGAIGFLYGLFDLVERTPFEIVFIVVGQRLRLSERGDAEPHAAPGRHARRSSPIPAGSRASTSPTRLAGRLR